MTAQPKQLAIKMPKLGLTMTAGTLVRWIKNEGDIINSGDILFEFESDKSLMEFESPAAGQLSQLLIEEGDTVPCGTPIAYLVSSQAAAEAVTAPDQHPAPPPAQLFSPTAMPAATRQANSKIILATPAAKRLANQMGLSLKAITGRGPNGRIHLADVKAVTQAAKADLGRSGTPLAKRIAREMGLDWTQLKGSGPGGRVVKADVIAASQPIPSAPDQPAQPVFADDIAQTTEPLSSIRRVIAQRMSDSAFSAPHVTLFTEADATNLVSARSQINAELNGTTKISYNALLTTIAARALREHPHMNACLVDDQVRRYREIHIALAVDTERGLLVPVIRNADLLDLLTIQQEGDMLIGRALAGRSLPDDLSGGTFTLTNLGMFEVDGFTPIINQPQAAILGVGRIVAKPVVVNNEIAVRQIVILSLSFDHRLVDGGPAARFLQRIKHLVERPFALLAPSPHSNSNP
jgi:pyruvate dehydrogenase E2 component (dihydrolipoamide acetyltransferase)